MSFIVQASVIMIVNYNHNMFIVGNGGIHLGTNYSVLNEVKQNEYDQILNILAW